MRELYNHEIEVLCFSHRSPSVRTVFNRKYIVDVHRISWLSHLCNDSLAIREFFFIVHPVVLVGDLIPCIVFVFAPFHDFLYKNEVKKSNRLHDLILMNIKILIYFAAASVTSFFAVCSCISLTIAL